MTNGRGVAHSICLLCMQLHSGRLLADANDVGRAHLIDNGDVAVALLADGHFVEAAVRNANVDGVAVPILLGCNKVIGAVEQ